MKFSLPGIATKKSIAAKPSKIVAGQEPERTNELLQAIGLAVQNKVDSKKAIEEWRSKQTKPAAKNDKTNAKKVATNRPKVVAAEVVEKVPTTEESEKKERVDSGIVEDGNPAQQEEEQEALEIDKPEEIVVAVENPPPATTTVLDQEPTEQLLTKTNNPSELESGQVTLPSTPSPPVSLPRPSAPPTVVDEKKQELINAIDEEADRRKKQVKKVTRKASSDNLLKDQPPSLEATPTTTTTTTRADSKINSVANNKRESRKNATKVETNPSAAAEKHPPPVTRPRTSLRPPSVRPASARPGAPRKRDRNVEVVLQPDENVQLGDINVKVEQFKATKSSLDAEDEENLIVIENIDIQDTLLAAVEGTRPEVVVVDGQNQGQLVKQILESQKEFESGDALKNDLSLNRSVGGNVAELRDQIQKLTKSIQPLGKFMDFLLEDIDSMQREHEMWRERGRDVSLKLAREKNSTLNTVQSMRHQLDEVNFELEEKRTAISNVRENILQNEERILKLFKNI